MLSEFEIAMTEIVNWAFPFVVAWVIRTSWTQHADIAELKEEVEHTLKREDFYKEIRELENRINDRLIDSANNQPFRQGHSG